MKKLGILFATLLMTLFFAVSVSALDATGSCGDNVNWKFNESTGELVISGTGEMENYNLEDSFSPFMSKTDVKSVVIKDGVTSVGDYTFTFCRSLTAVTIPDSVKSLGICSFANCITLKDLKLGKGITSIGALAFDSCDGLTKLTIPDKVTFIDEYAFQECDGLTEVKIGNGVKSLKFAFTGCDNLKKITEGSRDFRF